MNNYFDPSQPISYFLWSYIATKYTVILPLNNNNWIAFLFYIESTKSTKVLLDIWNRDVLWQKYWVDFGYESRELWPRSEKPEDKVKVRRYLLVVPLFQFLPARAGSMDWKLFILSLLLWSPMLKLWDWEAVRDWVIILGKWLYIQGWAERLVPGCEKSSAQPQHYTSLHIQTHADSNWQVNFLVRPEMHRKPVCFKMHCAFWNAHH